MNEAAKYLEKMENLNADVDNIQAEFTSQDKIAYLKRYKAIDKHIGQEIEELTKWNCRATKVTPTYSDMPKGGESSDKIQTAVEEMDEIKDQIILELKEAMKIRSEITTAIESVKDGTLQNLLTSRYILGYDRDDEAIFMNTSRSQCQRFHDKAIDKMLVHIGT